MAKEITMIKKYACLWIAILASILIAGSSVNAFAGVEHVHNGITFTELKSTDFEVSGDEKILKPGNYYLTQDWNFDKTVNITGTVNLCFNDHFIKNDGNVGHGFYVYGTGVLNLYDCGTSIRYWVPQTDSYYYTNRWFLQDSKPTGTEGKDYYVTHGGAITGISGGAISVGTKPPYDGSISLTDADIVGNGFYGLNFQGSGTCTLNGSTTIQGNAGRNASGKINNNLRYYGEGDAAGTPIIVSDGFSGQVGLTRVAITGVVSAVVAEGTESKFFADNDDYEVIRNTDKCLEIVPKTAKITIKGPHKDGSSESTLATIEKVNSKNFKVNETIKLPALTLKGYKIGKLYDYSKSEISPDKYEDGNDFVVPHADTILYANELALIIKEQPTTTKPTVVTEAEKVSYQWYERKMGDKELEFSYSGPTGGKYYSENISELTGAPVHISFPDGAPEDLKFEVGTEKKTGENSYDVVPVKVPMGRFLIYKINMSSSESFTVTAKVDKEIEAALEGQTEKTLTASNKGTYFCRITSACGITADSDDILIEKQEDSGGNVVDRTDTENASTANSDKSSGISTGDHNNLMTYFIFLDLVLAGIATLLFLRVKGEKKQ